MADGAPAQVFSQVELMENEGLTVPETTRLLYDLNREGFVLPLDILDMELCADAVAAAIRE